MRIITFGWFQLEIEKQLETVNKLVGEHTPETTEVDYMNCVIDDLLRVVATLEKHHAQAT